jgi:hypothetical protein
MFGDCSERGKKEEAVSQGVVSLLFYSVFISFSNNI